MTAPKYLTAQSPAPLQVSTPGSLADLRFAVEYLKNVLFYFCNLLQNAQTSIGLMFAEKVAISRTDFLQPTLSSVLSEIGGSLGLWLGLGTLQAKCSSDVQCSAVHRCNNPQTRSRWEHWIILNEGRSFCQYFFSDLSWGWFGTELQNDMIANQWLCTNFVAQLKSMPTYTLFLLKNIKMDCKKN